MAILYWALFGLVVGSVANLVDPHPSAGGWLGSIVLGIVGAVVGGFIGNALFGFGVSGFNVPSLIVAILGALLVMFVVRAIRRA